MKGFFELLQIAGIAVTLIGALFGWPISKIISKWEEERKINTRNIEALEDKVYLNEKDSSTKLSDHSVALAELKSGKVSHEQLREAVADMREAMKSSVESLGARMDQNRREDKEDLRKAMDDLKHYLSKKD